MNNKKIIEAMKEILCYGTCATIHEISEGCVECTEEEVKEADKMLRKFIRLCEKHLNN
tara:strand:- start:2096 stop:2269 length:174 start_codon:yes stop_codon:yes gene_type:complete